MRRASSSVAGSTRRSSRQPGRRNPASSVLNLRRNRVVERVSQARVSAEGQARKIKT